jgi:hypothetical protein
MGRVIPLGGRFFAPAEQTTSRQDGWIMVQLEDAGILALISKGADAFADGSVVRTLIVQAMRSGKYHAIIAGLLVEDKEPWTAESATKNGEFFAELTSPEDKQELSKIFEGMLTAFFLNGGRSSTPSPTASPLSNGSPPPKRKRVVRSTNHRAGSGPTAPGSSQMATPLG